MLPVRDELEVPGFVQHELSVARSSRANLLLVASDDLVVKLIRFVVPDLNQAATIRCQDGQLWLPPASFRFATVVVRDVEALTRDEQRRLCEWLHSGSNRTQVVSTSSAPLLTLVETGIFNDALYYRLNEIYVDLSE
jgi:hypothetical protein